MGLFYGLLGEIGLGYFSDGVPPPPPYFLCMMGGHVNGIQCFLKKGQARIANSGLTTVQIIFFPRYVTWLTRKFTLKGEGCL